MGISQQFVIGWLESMLAAFVLLAATRLVLARLRQPADRIHYRDTPAESKGDV